MHQGESIVVKQLRNLLKFWHVTYNVEDEKYVARTDALVSINSEQIEFIGKKYLLYVFSIDKNVADVTVKFSAGGCSN